MSKVIVYSTPSCAYCQMVKKFFNENDIEFEEKNVAEDKDSAKEMMEKSGQMGVPVIDIDDQIIVGFNKEKIIEVLGL
jgi:glutaredoxin-like YruB-family protein